MPPAVSTANERFYAVVQAITPVNDLEALRIDAHTAAHHAFDAWNTATAVERADNLLDARLAAVQVRDATETLDLTTT